MNPQLTLQSLWDGVDLNSFAISVHASSEKSNKTNSQVSYGKLQSLTDSIDEQLKKLGFPKGCVVSLIAPRSLETAILIVSITVSGRICAPLNPNLGSVDGFKFILEDIGGSLLLVPPINEETSSNAIEAATELGILVCAYENYDEQMTISTVSLPPKANSPKTARKFDADVAFLMHTSGTTSRPKLVPITHTMVATNMTALTDIYKLAPNDVVIHILPLFHIAGIAIGLLSTLASGGHVVICPVFDPLTFPQLLREYDVTWFTAVPALFKAMLDHKGAFQTQTKGNNVASSLRFIRSGAAAMDPKDVVELETLFGVPLIDSFGMTETAGGVFSTLPMGPRGPPGTLGVPITSTLHVEIRGEDGQEVSEGTVGEVCLKGPSIHTGYINNDEANADSFFSDGFFRTGDLGLVNKTADGSWLTLTGRKKELINRGGEKVSPYEVEEVALADALLLRVAVCFSMPDDVYGEQVALAVVPSEKNASATDVAYAVLATCRKSLSAYQVPSTIFVLDSDAVLPKTSTGKLQRNAMHAALQKAGKEPALQMSQLDARIISSAPFGPPTNQLETNAIKIWEHVLGLKGIGILDDIFELGGTSIMAARIAILMQEEAGKLCTGGTVLQARCIQNVCKAMADARSTKDDAITSMPSPTDKNIPSVDEDGNSFLSFSQEEFLILQHLNPGSGFYNQPLMLALMGTVDHELVKKSLESIVARHDALRTIFELSSSGQWIATALPPEKAKMPFSEIDVSSKNFEISSPAFEEMIVAESSKPFDLSVDVPLRACLYTLGHCSVLLVVFHHISTDGWSMNIVQNELAALYTSGGNAKSLPSLPLTTKKYGAWQQQISKLGCLDNQAEYWKKQLVGVEPLLLPSDRPRPAQQSTEGALETFRIPAEMLSKLKRVSQANGATLFMTTLAAFQLHMKKLSGLDRFAVGSPAAGRSHREFERVISCFVNPVALVADLSSDEMIFSDFLAEVKTTTLNALENAALPFTKVVENSQTERTSSYTPIFQTMFVLQERVLDGIRQLGEDASMKLHRLSTGATARFDLFLELFDEGDAGMLGRIEYCTALFDRETVQRWIQQYILILQQICSHPDLPLKAFCLMTKAETQVLLNSFQRPLRPDYVKYPLIHHAFEAVAASDPKRACLQFDGAVMTYGEVNAAANVVAHSLMARGVGGGHVVGIMIERSFDLVVSLLGALKSGAGYLPCDPDYPDDRLAIYLEDASASVLLSQASHMDRARSLVGSGCKVLDAAIVHAEGSKKWRKPKNPPADRTNAEGVCYIIFTSGSTGRPKGVMVPHRGVRDLMPWLVDLHGLDSKSVIVFSNTISFDVHIMQWMPPLTVGAKLVISKPKGHLDPDYMADLLISTGITSTIFTVPTLASEYIRSPTLEETYLGMRTWGLGGESVPLGTMRRMQEVFPKASIINSYGPTEVTAICVHHTYSFDDTIVVIGKPDVNVHAYVVDSTMRPVPVGVPGELLLSGPRLALGYAGRADLTAEKFISNPCYDLISSNLPADLEPFYRLAYRTGDLVRWRPNGEIEFLGRIDRQVKVNGVRIELGEVESTLDSAEGVDAAVVSTIVDAKGKQRLAGYVVPGSVDTAALLAHCRDLLIPAMVPSIIVAMDAFPLLPNGKVDVRSLPVPNWEGGDEEEYVAPETEIETAVQAAFAHALKQSPQDISVVSDFFFLGGTSLQVFRVVAEIQQLLKISSLPTSLIHTERTVRRIGKALAISSTHGSTAPDALAVHAWPDACRPLSFNQEQMWLLNQISGASAYNMRAVLKLSKTPDLDAMQVALDRVAARHETLRTRFQTQSDGNIGGTIVPTESFHVPLKVKTVSGSKIFHQIADELAYEASQGFNLEKDPLIRAMIIISNDGSAVLAVTCHHAVGDAWSFGILYRELSQAYLAAVEKTSPSWEPLPIQYSDFAAWQKRHVNDIAGDSLKKWWKESLAGVPSLIQLPTDHPRPLHPTYKAGSFKQELPGGLLDQVEVLAHDLSINVQAVLLAAFQIVLIQYSGQDDLVIGVPVAGREQRETHQLIGYFINTMPIRCSAAEDSSLADVATKTSKVLLAALDHSLLPLEDIVVASNAERVTGTNPLFQVLFQYMPTAATYTAIVGPVFGDIPVQDFTNLSSLEHAKVDLSLIMTGNKIDLQYMAELFEEKTLDRLMGSFIAALNQMVSTPSKKIAETSLLSQHDVKEITRMSIGEERNYLGKPLTHHAFEAMTAVSPSRQCLHFNGESMTYGDVDARCNALSLQLAALGVEPGYTVGVMLERSFDLIIAIMAIFKAGGCYLPCDPSYPDDRLSVYVEDGKALLMLVKPQHAERAAVLAGPGVRILDISEDNAKAMSGKDVSLRQSGPEDPAYILFTSGSTGRPKGVVISHRALRDHVFGTQEFYNMGPDDASLLTITINFDPHLMQMLPPLVCGGRLVIARPDGHADGDYVSGLIAKYNVTHFVSTPSLALVQFGGPTATDCVSLRYVLTGGENMSRELINFFAEKLPWCKLYNVYGPTEATITATEGACSSVADTITIGRPVYNMHCYIVDAMGRAVPVGVPGELLLSGPRLAHGYAGRADLTAEKFIPNPCLDLVKSSLTEENLPHYQLAYRSGDLVRWCGNGQIEFLGRIDRQVKITGVRIELGEVEAALENATGVTLAVAAAVPDAHGQKRLVGYVTPGSVNSAAVIAYCRDVLIPAMVPSVIIAMDAFPLLPSGKVDTKALPVPDWSGADTEEYVEPETELEKTVTKVFAEVLGRKEPLSVLADFFAAGGTSLQAFRVNTSLQRALGLDGIPPTMLHTNRTARAISTALQELMRSGRSEFLAPIKPQKWKDNLRPLSSNQEQMWVLAKNGQSVAYNMPFLLTLSAAPNMKILEKSFNAVVKHHEVLRMRYVESDGVPKGMVFDAKSVSVPVRHQIFKKREDLLKALQEEAKIPFDFNKDILIRAFVGATEDGSFNTLAITMHHAIGDLWSRNIVAKELSAAYTALASGSKPSFSSLPIQYADYAAWQQQMLTGAEASKAMEHWRNELSGAPSMLQLPIDRARPNKPTFEAATYSTELPRDLFANAAEASRRLNVNTQAVLMAAVQLVLMRYSGQDDLVVGIPTANRDRLETQDLVGYFINTVPVRGRAFEEDTFADLAVRISQSTISGLENSFLPTSEIVKASGVEFIPNTSPLFQVLFQYLTTEFNEGALTLGSISTEILSRKWGPPQSKIDMVITMYPNGLLRVDYSAELFNPLTVARLASSIVIALREVLEHPEAKLAAVSLLSPADRETVLSFATLNLRPQYLTRPLIHHAFEAVAASDPKRACLQFDGAVMTYGEVNAAANVVAHSLMARGVGGGHVVGIMIERSFDLVVSLLGALKSGAGYLPCDPDYPDDRLAIYLEDASASVLLSQASHMDRARSLVGSGCEVLDAAVILDKSSKKKPGNPPADRTNAEGVCYIIFTSGSTGRPKGVMVPHRGVRDLMPWVSDLHGLGSSDVVAFSNTISFDAHVLQWMPPMYFGAKLVIAKPKGHLDPDYMAELIVSEKISSMVVTVPTLAIEYLRSPALHGTHLDMHSWGMGGESVPLDLMSRMQQVFPNARIINIYGPTEATVMCTSHVFSAADSVVVIGGPDPNMHTYIVDPSFQMVPIGVPGELLLSGPRLALGYSGRADLTAEKFISNPCYDVVSSNLPADLEPFYRLAYRTGDLVRWRPNGKIEFLGRIDRQVKVNGVRIELGEVESALGGAKGVEAAVVSTVADSKGKQKLVAYVIPDTADTAALLAHCRDLLIPAMVPSIIVAMDAFPLLPNGKVDVRSLPVPNWEGGDEEEYVAPENDIEKSVVKVWSDVLGRKDDNPLSVVADFFASGGTSLQVFRVNAAMQKVLSIDGIPPTLLHTNRTARAAAAALKQFLSSGASPSYSPIHANKWRDNKRPLSTNQEQMWFLAQTGNSAAYNMPLSFEIDGQIDPKTFQSSLDYVASRHEVLRTIFEEADGLPIGKVIDSSKFSVPFKMQSFSSHEKLLGMLEQEATAEFDFSSHLLRVFFATIEDGSFKVLLINLHHAVGDLWSFNILKQELSAAYSAFSNGSSPSLPAMSIQYGDYAAWQQQLLSSDAATKADEYWRKQLGGAPSMLQLPMDRLRPSFPTCVAANYIEKLPEGLLAHADGVANDLKVNTQALLLSVCQLVLMRYSGQDDIVVGMPTAGRDQIETQELIGYFINTVPVRSQMYEDDTFAGLAKRTSKAVVEGLENSFLPLSRLVDVADVERIVNVNPLFQVLFQYIAGVDMKEGDLSFGGVSASPFTREKRESKAKMDMVITIAPGGILSIEYMSELFDESTIANIASSISTALEQALDNPDTKTSEISLLGDTAMKAVMDFATLNLRPQYLTRPLIHHAFEAVAASDPKRACLQFDGAVMTYGEVNAAANVVAHSLMARGVGGGHVVGIMIERSFDLVVSLLGALKSGAGYLPCDPDYPDDRLAIYLEDASASVLLSQASHMDRARSLVGSGCEVLDAAVILDKSSKKKPGNPPADRTNAEGVCYIIFTSGSTGRPKGVMVPHRGVRDLMPWVSDLHGLGSSDVVAFSNTISFDAHVLQWMPPMYFGAKLVIAKPKGHLDPDYMAELIVSEKISSMVVTVPTLAIEYLRSPALHGTHLDMHSWGMGGESVPLDLMSRMQQVFPNARIINLYGPTEATVMCTSHVFSATDSVVVIGGPDPNMHTYIVDPSFQMVPIGVPGELLLSGPRLALGYSGRADLTAEKFISNPCYDVVSSNLPADLEPFYRLAYRTGDLVRWRPNGKIEFLGRIDRQVKVNGVRIELGEVESALGGAKGVEAAVVSTVADSKGKQKLVAYVIPDTADTAALLAHCRDLLIPAMVPSIIVAMDAFPLLPNGKVDVRSLPEPDWSKVGNVATLQEDDTTVLDKYEISVTDIIKDVVGLDPSFRVPLQAELFDLGASSIQVASIVSRIRKQLAVDLDMRQVYQDPVVKSLCDAVKAQKEDGDGGLNAQQSAVKRRWIGFPLPLWQEYISQDVASRIISSVVQLISICIIISVIFGSFVPGIYLITFFYRNYGTWQSILIGPLVYPIWCVCLLIFTFLAKWILIGRYVAGTHPIWSWYFTRWWIVQRLSTLNQPVLRHLTGTPFLRFYLRAMGSSIGWRSELKSVLITDYDLIYIGNDCIIGEGVTITPHCVERGYLSLAPVFIGNDTNIGMLSIVMPQTSIDNGVSIAAMSMIPLGTALPPMTAWEGSPVRPKEGPLLPPLGSKNVSGNLSKVEEGNSEQTELQGKPLNKRLLQSIQVFACFLVLTAVWVSLLPTIAGVMYTWGSRQVLVAVIIGFGLVLTHIIYMVEAIILKWLILGKSKEGRYHARSFYSARVEIVNLLLSSPIAKSFCSLFAETPVVTLTLKALGAKLDGGNIIFKISPLMLVGADQVHLQKYATLGQDVGILGIAFVGDTLLVAPTRIGKSCFIGDAAIIMPGCEIGMGAMLGVQSIIQPFTKLNRGSIWTGSPAFCMDPGLRSTMRLKADGSYSQHHGTRWQYAQEQFRERPNSQVLSAERLVRSRTARMNEGSAGFTIEEEVEGLQLTASQKLRGTNTRSWLASKSVKRTPTKKMLDQMNTLRGPSSRPIAFSQAVMVVNQLQAIRGSGFSYAICLMTTPLLLIPAVLFASLVGPLYILNIDSVDRGHANYKYFPVSAVAFLVGAVLLLLIIKQLLGKFKVASFNYYGKWTILRSTALNVLHMMASGIFLDALMGTRWGSWYLSALGAKIGQDVYIESLPLIEADLLTIGDRVTLDAGARFVPYTVENGCLDYLEVTVKSDVTVGPRAYVLPSGTLESHSAIGPLSVLLKADVVLKGTYAEGSPLIHIGTWFDPTAVKPGNEPERLELLKTMENDAVLPVDIRLPDLTTSLGSPLPQKLRTGRPQTAFLTGASGFVGCFILRELIRQGVHRVYCLIRCTSEENGASRVKKQLVHHELCTDNEWDTDFASKVKILPGDLGSKSIGLSEETLAQLADEVDVIINNGAFVNVTKGYETMKASNVDSVLTLLKMAVGGRAPTPLHQISTLGTMPRFPKGKLHENYDNSDPNHLYVGYDQTKWVAEQLILKARSNGIPVALHRLGRIGGDTVSGGSNENDYVMLTIKGCLQLACFPKNFDVDLNIIPGDVTARVIVDKAMNPAAVGQIYHVTNPKPKPFQLAVNVLKNMGYQFEELHYLTWRERLLTCAADDNALKPLELAYGKLRKKLTAQVDCTNAGIMHGTLNPEQLRRDFEWCTKVGFFPPLPPPSQN